MLFFSFPFIPLSLIHIFGIFSAQNIVRLLNRDNAYFLAVAAHALEFYLAIFESEQGIVAADAYVLSWMNVSTSLTVQDVASQYELTVCAFCAKTLGFRVTAVLCGTNTFFMSKELHAKSKHCCRCV